MFRLADRLGLQIAATLDPVMYSAEEPIYPIYGVPTAIVVNERILLYTGGDRIPPTWERAKCAGICVGDDWFRDALRRQNEADDFQKWYIGSFIPE